MKAVAVVPGRADSLHLVELPMPGVEDITEGRGVFVKVLQVGLDGTDREINAGAYGAAPPGSDFLVLGHESLGVVEQVGNSVTELVPGDYVVPTVRRPGKSIYDTLGMSDMTTDDTYYEHGISLLHGFLREYYVDVPENLVGVPEKLSQVAALLEPTSIVEKGILQAYEIQRRLPVWHPQRAVVLGAGTLGLLATLLLRLKGLEVVTLALEEPPYLNSELVEALGATYVSTRRTSLSTVSAQLGPIGLIFEAAGFSPLAFEAMEVLGKNGVLVLSGVTSGKRTVEVPADVINLGFVLGNKVMVGTVNANRAHFEDAVRDMAVAEALYPGWLARLLTHRVVGLEQYQKAFSLLNGDPRPIKVVVEVASP